MTEDWHVLASGYNGAPRGMEHCTDVGCLMVDGHCVRTLHSEWNMINQAAFVGVTSLKGTSIYLTARPCQTCTKQLVQLKVKDIHYWKAYNTDGIKDQVEMMLEHAGIPIFGPYEKRCV